MRDFFFKYGNFNIKTIYVSSTLPNLIPILNKLNFYIKQSYQTPKYLLNKHEMTIKVKTSKNPMKLI